MKKIENEILTEKDKILSILEVSNKTRNLEQLYIAKIIKRYQKIINYFSKKMNEVENKKTENKEEIDLKDLLLKFNKINEENASKLQNLESFLKNKNQTNFEVENTNYRNKIKELEKTVETLKNKKTEKNNNNDIIILLKDQIKEKEKIIKDQNIKIKELEKNNVNLEEIILPETLSLNKNPYEELEKKPKKKKKQRQEIKVKEIIEKEKKSFFNNLSFTNSSPVIKKKKKD